jgi:hypothetical protein
MPNKKLTCVHWGWLTPLGVDEKQVYGVIYNYGLPQGPFINFYTTKNYS